jgi:hypothetical protein
VSRVKRAGFTSEEMGGWEEQDLEISLYIGYGIGKDGS